MQGNGPRNYPEHLNVRSVDFNKIVDLETARLTFV